MVRNCGMVLILIRHAQNAIRSNQYPIKFVLRGIGKVPPYTSCFLRTSRNPNKRLLYEKNILIFKNCGEDILLFLRSFKINNIITDLTNGFQTLNYILPKSVLASFNLRLATIHILKVCSYPRCLKLYAFLFLPSCSLVHKIVLSFSARGMVLFIH